MDKRLLRDLTAKYVREKLPSVRAGELRFKRMPSLAQAIKEAVLSRTEDGKCESHQRRVGYQKLKRFEEVVQGLRRSVGACSSFEDLYDLLFLNRIAGVGPLAVYDISVRLGSFLGLKPKHVYLHTGALEGAKALGLPTEGGRIERTDLPDELQRLRPVDVEHFLCMYKRHFRSGGKAYHLLDDHGCGPRRRGSSRC